MDFRIAEIMDLYEEGWPLLVQRGKKDNKNFSAFPFPQNNEYPQDLRSLLLE